MLSTTLFVEMAKILRYLPKTFSFKVAVKLFQFWKFEKISERIIWVSCEIYLEWTILLQLLLITFYVNLTLTSYMASPYHYMNNNYTELGTGVASRGISLLPKSGRLCSCIQPFHPSTNQPWQAGWTRACSDWSIINDERLCGFLIDLWFP